MVGAVAALWIMGTPFGFMAFLGVASLVGVIVSHIIVLFDFIEESGRRASHCRKRCWMPGSCGCVRTDHRRRDGDRIVPPRVPWRPALGADVLCADRGGLTVATFITLLLVPVIYAIFVLI